MEAEKGKRVAVDLFFRSLAEAYGPHAAAIVLSGADGDGALGIKRIKERGGLTIAQDPEEAEHQGMPRAAIATGMVDWVLRVAEMPQRLVEYHANEQRLRLPPEDGPQPAQAPKTTLDEGEAALREVLTFLRTRTGRDFSYYKRATIVRRISRRLQINGLDDLPAYRRQALTRGGARERPAAAPDPRERPGLRDLHPRPGPPGEQLERRGPGDVRLRRSGDLRRAR